MEEGVGGERRGPMGLQEVQEAGIVNLGHGCVRGWRGKREVGDR